MIFIASDHAGFALKNKLIELNTDLEWEDIGPQNSDRVDYPDFAEKLCNKLNENPDSFGVLVCGSGQGMAIAANRHKHIRAALCWNEEVTKLSREHNNANVLCLGSRTLDHDVCHRILQVFLTTQFEGGRHADRVAKLS